MRKSHGHESRPGRREGPGLSPMLPRATGDRAEGPGNVSQPARACRQHFAVCKAGKISLFNSEPQVNIHCFSGFSQACLFLLPCVYIVLAPFQASLSLDRGALSYKLYVFGILVLPFLRMNVNVLKLELDKTIHWLMCVTCVRQSPGGSGRRHRTEWVT